MTARQRHRAQSPWAPERPDLSEAAKVPAWVDDAACAEVGGDIWFPEDGDNGTFAKRICGMCIVQDSCLDYALEHGIEHGIWGGESRAGLRRIRQQRQQEAAA